MIHYKFKELEAVLSKLSIREKDKVTDTVVQLCTEYSKNSFMEGMRTDIQLANARARILEKERLHNRKSVYIKITIFGKTETF